MVRNSKITFNEPAPTKLTSYRQAADDVTGRTHRPLTAHGCDYKHNHAMMLRDIYSLFLIDLVNFLEMTICALLLFIQNYFGMSYNSI